MKKEYKLFMEYSKHLKIYNNNNSNIPNIISQDEFRKIRVYVDFTQKNNNQYQFSGSQN